MSRHVEEAFRQPGVIKPAVNWLSLPSGEDQAEAELHRAVEESTAECPEGL